MYRKDDQILAISEFDGFHKGHHRLVASCVTAARRINRPAGGVVLDRAKPSAGAHPPQPSTNTYAPSNNPVLRQAVESAQFTSIRYSERLDEIGATPSIGSAMNSRAAPASASRLSA